MKDSIQNAMLGALVADAFTMPVHWYYDTNALDHDYPELEYYQAPRNPHPDSILWRSKYRPKNKEADILHDQAAYWGQRGVHYHQHLAAGENTLNFRLGVELYRTLVRDGHYDPQAWLEHYVSCMRTPGWHADTYVEEYHRAFFEHRAAGKPLDQCGVRDIHIGGLTPVPFLLAAFDAIEEREVDVDCASICAHLALTHHGKEIRAAGETLVRLIHAIAAGQSLRTAISAVVDASIVRQFDLWLEFADRTVVGRHLTPACYLPESLTASLYLAWKYHDDFSAGIRANALCGGDNCHRGVVVGALLGAANGVGDTWLAGLKPIRHSTGGPPEAGDR